MGGVKSRRSIDHGANGDRTSVGERGSAYVVKQLMIREVPGELRGEARREGQIERVAGAFVGVELGMVGEEWIEGGLATEKRSGSGVGDLDQGEERIVV